MDSRSGYPRRPSNPSYPQQRRRDDMDPYDMPPDPRYDDGRGARFGPNQGSGAMRQGAKPTTRKPLYKNPLFIVAAFVATCLSLCVLSVFGGIALSGALSRPPDAKAAAQSFWANMEAQDYTSAYGSLNPRADQLQSFSQSAGDADKALGPITTVKLLTQQGGTPNDTHGVLAYSVSRSGGTANGAADYSVTLQLAYENSHWDIIDYGKLFSNTPTQPQGTPSPTAKPGS